MNPIKLRQLYVWLIIVISFPYNIPVMHDEFCTREKTD